jgi:hypothetical protein
MMTLTAPASTPTPVNPSDLIRLFSKHRRMIVTGTLISTGLFLLAAFTLPKRYKASFVLSIHMRYFQNPLTRDFMPEIFDTTEMRAQREALIRQSLTPEFIDSLGTKYGIYGTRTEGPVQRFLKYISKRYGVYLTTKELRTRSDERKGLLENIQVLNLNSDSFQIGFQNSNPDVTYRVIQDIYAHVTQGLLDARRSNLSAIQEAMRKRLDALASKLPSLESRTPKSAGPKEETVTAESASPQSAEEELADVRNQLRFMTVRFTDDHPMVRELRARERALLAVARTQRTTPANVDVPLAIRIPADAAEEIYRELTKKLNYLNISLDSDQIHSGEYFATLEAPLYPSSPLWPKKGLFLLWGLGAGLLITLFIAAIREYFDHVALRSELLSSELGIPVLGEMPVIHWGAALPNALRLATSLERPGHRN